MRQPVIFDQAVKGLYEAGCTHFIEIGPHSALIRSAKETINSDENLFFIPSLLKNLTEGQGLSLALANLFVSGFLLDWEIIFKITPQALSLPTDPFQSQGVLDSPESFSKNQKVISNTYEEVMSIPVDQRPMRIEVFLQSLVKKLTGNNWEEGDRTRPLVELGIDSLLSIEFLNRVEKSYL